MPFADRRARLRLSWPRAAAVVGVAATFVIATDGNAPPSTVDANADASRVAAPLLLSRPSM
eukprot:8732018-Lingulodinium_polyedra.AAC.1